MIFLPPVSCDKTEVNVYLKTKQLISTLFSKCYGHNKIKMNQLYKDYDFRYILKLIFNVSL